MTDKDTGGQAPPPPYTDAAPGYPGAPGENKGYADAPPGYPGGYPQQQQPGQPYPVQPGQPQQYYMGPGQPQYGAPPQGYNTQYGVGYGPPPNVVGAPMVMQGGNPPPDYFCQAIFVTLCCFWPTGIIAIMKASDARASTARGDMVTANAQARSAKQMVNISIGVGIASIVLMCVIVGIYVGVILNNVYY